VREGEEGNSFFMCKIQIKKNKCVFFESEMESRSCSD